MRVMVMNSAPTRNLVFRSNGDDQTKTHSADSSDVSQHFRHDLLLAEAKTTIRTEPRGPRGESRLALHKNAGSDSQAKAVWKTEMEEVIQTLYYERIQQHLGGPSVASLTETQRLFREIYPKDLAAQLIKELTEPSSIEAEPTKKATTQAKPATPAVPIRIGHRPQNTIIDIDPETGKPRSRWSAAKSFLAGLRSK